MLSGWTAGERVEVHGAPPWLAEILACTLAPEVVDGDGVTDPQGTRIDPTRSRAEVSVRVDVEATRMALPLPDRCPIGRGVWAAGGAVLVEDACSSGFDLLLTPPGPGAVEPLSVRARYRPGVPTRAANSYLRQRFRLLARQTLVQYPVLWLAGLHGGVPLHACAVRTVGSHDGGLLLIGPGGIGKSTLLLAEIAAGGVASSDNLSVWRDGAALGVVEPLRVAGGTGPRTTNGRRERDLPGRVARIRPDRLVLLERQATPSSRPRVRNLTVEDAARALVGGTYAAGELRRYWQLAAMLGLATGLGPAHPAVAEVALRIADAAPCLAVSLPPGATLSTVLAATQEAAGATTRPLEELEDLR